MSLPTLIAARLEETSGKRIAPKFVRLFLERLCPGSSRIAGYQEIIDPQKRTGGAVCDVSGMRLNRRKSGSGEFAATDEPESPDPHCAVRGGFIRFRFDLVLIFPWSAPHFFPS